MRFTRLFSVTAMVAAVTLLASCGESSTPTSPSAATNPSMDAGPRYVTLTPANPGWTKQPNDPIPTDPRTVLIGGLIAVAGYPSFGAPVYAGTSPAGNWLDMDLAPNFSRTPLGWTVTFTLKASAAALPIGSYTATIAVTVPAALNNPQNIVVTFNNCGNCLFLGDSRLTTITTSSPTFDWRADNFYGSGTYYYYEYRLFLLAGETAFVQNWGSGLLGGTIGDPTVALYNADTFSAIGHNDDCNGLSSQYMITNSSGVTKEYRVRASSYSSGVTGTETIVISPTSYCGGDDESLRASLPADIQAIIAAKAAHGGH